MDLETAFSQYDAAGRAGRITDPNGQARTLTYDGRGRVLTETHVSDGAQTAFVYTAGGEIYTVTDPDGVTRTYTYDQNFGRLDRMTAANGDYMLYLYDDRGNLTEQSNHMPDTTRTSRKRWDYDHPTIPGKLWKETQSDDTFTVYDYDEAGNEALVTDPKNQTTSYSYDFMNRLESVLQPGDGLTSYEYDTHGNLISVTDAEDQETTYLYDDLGRMVSTTSPDTETQTYVYDEAGNLVSKTDAKGITVTYGYDDLNRLTEAQFPDSGQNVTYTYDQGTNGLGHLTGFSDPSGSTSFGYYATGGAVPPEKQVSSQDTVIRYQGLTSSAGGCLASCFPNLGPIYLKSGLWPIRFSTLRALWIHTRGCLRQTIRAGSSVFAMTLISRPSSTKWRPCGRRKTPI
jgi:YD repeat-containing protein